MKNPPPAAAGGRRRHPRIIISVDVDWGETPACAHEGRVTSLSAGGCFLQTPLEVARGKPVFIRLFLAPGSERVVEGVVWGRVAYHLEKVGLGVEFKKLPPGYEKHIQDLVVGAGLFGGSPFLLRLSGLCYATRAALAQDGRATPDMTTRTGGDSFIRCPYPLSYRARRVSPTGKA